MDQVALHRNMDLSTTQALVLGSNPKRNYALLQNVSDTDCWISLGVPAAANEGPKLQSAVGSYEINDINLWRGKIYAVSGGVGKRLVVTEW